MAAVVCTCKITVDGETTNSRCPPGWKLIFFFQDTSRRYENKAGAFITGIDVNSKVRSPLDRQGHL